jgi:hypothetical protein
MNNRLSHSAINKYLFCGESFRLHYREGYRSNFIGSALLFGKALDMTFEYILTGKNVVNEPDKEIADEYEYFDYHWRTQYVNDVLTNIFINEGKAIHYGKNDPDYDLLTSEEIKEAGDNTDKIAWFSLRHKGHLMIDTFKNEFVPKIKKIHSTQELIELENDQGDKSIGYCDAVLELEGYDKPIITDFKTSGKPYAEDSVQYSVQLSQYLHALSDKYNNTRLASYVVFMKNINKNKVKICKKCGFDGSGAKFKTCNNIISNARCGGDWIETLNPKAEMQLIVDEIPQEVEHLVIDNIGSVNTSIKLGIFNKNVNGCKDAGFGKPCDFFDFCWKKDPAKLYKIKTENE